MARLLRLEKSEGVFGPTLQGEGRNIGAPCIFVRLYGCDFRCKWCDTPFSLGKDLGGEYEEVEAEEILQRINAINGHYPNWVVVSGGNPLVQGMAFDTLVELLHHVGYQVQVETQGSVGASVTALKNVSFWSISPKLLSAGSMESSNWKAVPFYTTNVPPSQMQLKFVIADEADYDFLKAKLRLTIGSHSSVPIILQPEGQQQSDTFDFTLYTKSIEQLFSWVKRDGRYWAMFDVQILPQYHKLLWGKERKR